MGNTAQQCRLGLFQDSDFAGDLEDSKSTSGGILCIFGSQTFVPISWMCKKQNTLTRSVTKWTQARDRRLTRLISYIHFTSVFRQCCHVRNTAQRCRLGFFFFQDSDFAGDLGDSKSYLGGISFIFGSRTFVPTSWMCKKQTAVSHDSTESEVISLDTGLRMDGLFALCEWLDMMIEVS